MGTKKNAEINVLTVVENGVNGLMNGIDYKSLESVNKAIAMLSTVSDKSQWNIAKIITLADLNKTYTFGIKQIDATGNEYRKTYKTLDKWCGDIFGYSKSATYNLKKCVNYCFALAENNTFVAYDEMVSSFTTGKIQILFPLFAKYEISGGSDYTYANQMIRDLIDNQTISLVMSANELKKVVKELLSDDEAIDAEAKDVETSDEVETDDAVVENETDDAVVEDVDSIPLNAVDSIDKLTIDMDNYAEIRLHLDVIVNYIKSTK